MINSSLSLPAELRVEVYKHLIIDSLADGAASDVGGLYMTCQFIKAEMEEFITNARPLLTLLHGWNTEHAQRQRLPNSSIATNNPQISPLRVHASPGPLFTNILTNVTVDIPVPQIYWLLRRPADTWLLFRLHITTLTLRLYLPDEPTKPLDPICAAHAFSRLLSCSWIHLRPRLTFKHTERLILRLGTLPGLPLDYWRTLYTSTSSAVNQSLSRVTLGRFQSGPKYRRWAAMTDEDGSQEWTVGFDFKEGLDKAKGKVYYIFE